MGAFAEILDKVSRMDREARLEARSSLMESQQVTARDIEEGKWEIREEGSFGHTAVSIWKKVEQRQVSIESLVRKSIS